MTWPPWRKTHRAATRALSPAAHRVAEASMTLFGQVSRALCRSPLFRPRSPLPRVSAPKVRPPRLGPHGPARGFRSPMRPYVVTAVLCACLGTSVSFARRPPSPPTVDGGRYVIPSSPAAGANAEWVIVRPSPERPSPTRPSPVRPSPPHSIYGQPSSPGQRGVDTYRV